MNRRDEFMRGVKRTSSRLLNTFTEVSDRFLNYVGAVAPNNMRAEANNAINIDFSAQDAAYRAALLRSEYRQLGAVILALGMAATYGTLAEMVDLVGKNSSSSLSGLGLASFVGLLAQAFFGTLAMISGFATLVMDTENVRLTAYLILSIQLAFISYITNMVRIGQAARSGSAFIPDSYTPSTRDVKWFGAMGVLAVMAYGVAYVGSLALVTFELSAFQTGNVHERSSGFYRSRLYFYSLVLTMAGFTQLAIGSYALGNIGLGPLQDPIQVAMYTVYFPEIAYVVGLLQMLIGSYGVFRSFRVSQQQDQEDNSFEQLSAFMYLCMLVLQIMVQTSYAPDGALAAESPKQAFSSLGLAFLPAYLDHKMRNTPEFLDPGDFGLQPREAQKEANSSIETHEYL